MAEIVLIHGYGYGSTVDHPVLKHYIFTGFQAFEPLVQQQRAKLFDWSVPRVVGVDDISNPLKQYQIYREDKKRALSDQTQQALTTFLSEEQPSVIVAHSMGSRILMEQVHRVSLPQSVRHVAFIQADLPHTYIPDETDFYSRVKKHQIQWRNYYCPWDNALLASMVINRYFPKGVIGSKNPLIRNIFFPLRKGPNFHTSGIRDERFRQEIEQLLK